MERIKGVVTILKTSATSMERRVELRIMNAEFKVLLDAILTMEQFAEAVTGSLVDDVELRVFTQEGG